MISVRGKFNEPLLSKQTLWLSAFLILALKVYEPVSHFLMIPYFICISKALRKTEQPEVQFTCTKEDGKYLSVSFAIY